jgi:hypothetical protein
MTPLARLRALVRAHLVTDGDVGVRDLARRLRGARDRGYLNPKELEAVCRWKSPRAIRQIQRNSARDVRTLTRRALRARDEGERIAVLLELHGVSIPMASAALTLLYPRRYAVIDIRVWQLLHAEGAVTQNARGVGLRLAHWQEFLAVVTRLARQVRITPRRVERTLFDIHRARQEGTLYAARPSPPGSPGRSSPSRSGSSRRPRR